MVLIPHKSKVYGRSYGHFSEQRSVFCKTGQLAYLARIRVEPIPNGLGLPWNLMELFLRHWSTSPKIFRLFWCLENALWIFKHCPVFPNCPYIRQIRCVLPKRVKPIPNELGLTPNFVHRYLTRWGSFWYKTHLDWTPTEKVIWNCTKALFWNE